MYQIVNSKTGARGKTFDSSPGSEIHLSNNEKVEAIGSLQAQIAELAGRSMRNYQDALAETPLSGFAHDQLINAGKERLYMHPEQAKFFADKKSAKRMKQTLVGQGRPSNGSIMPRLSRMPAVPRLPRW